MNKTDLFVILLGCAIIILSAQIYFFNQNKVYATQQNKYIELGDQLMQEAANMQYCRPCQQACSTQAIAYYLRANLEIQENK